MIRPHETESEVIRKRDKFAEESSQRIKSRRSKEYFQAMFIIRPNGHMSLHSSRGEFKNTGLNCNMYFF